MERALTAILVVAAIVNILPMAGVASAARLEAMYGVAVDGSDMAILMRHRAVLLGIVGALLLVAAFRPDWRTPAILAGLVSMLSFVAVAFLEGGFNGQLRTVLRIDVVASILLLGGAALHFSR
jgi:hypothetical protein